MDKKFYITTPIYYPSAKPHMGHAYSSIIADFFARFKRIDGFQVHFLTGTDEHGLKIQRSAEKNNIETMKFCNQISETFRSLSKTLNLTNTDFIRTTEVRHKKTVQYLWNELLKNDDIYLSKYSGWYSVSDEAFYTEDEIEEIDGNKRSISSKSSVVLIKSVLVKFSVLERLRNVSLIWSQNCFGSTFSFSAERCIFKPCSSVPVKK